MPIAVVLDLDTTAANVEALWDVLEQDPELTTTRRIGVRPHLTLAVYHALDLPPLLPRFEGFARGLHPVAIHFASIGIFAAAPRATIFLAPVADRVLLDLHDRLHRKFADCLDRASRIIVPHAGSRTSPSPRTSKKLRCRPPSRALPTWWSPLPQRSTCFRSCASCRSSGSAIMLSARHAAEPATRKQA
jgi:hypothetical protein